jgi:magnesium and cobalt transporter
MITIEDVLEQIVGDIDDEYDFDEQDENIIAEADGKFRVRALTEIEQFNASFGTRYTEDEYNTVGGMVTDAFGRVPRRGDAVEIDGMRFEVLRADARQAHLFLVSRVPKTVAREFADGEAGQHA